MSTPMHARNNLKTLRCKTQFCSRAQQQKAANCARLPQKMHVQDFIQKSANRFRRWKADSSKHDPSMCPTMKLTRPNPPVRGGQKSHSTHMSYGKNRTFRAPATSRDAFRGRLPQIIDSFRLQISKRTNSARPPELSYSTLIDTTLSYRLFTVNKSSYIGSFPNKLP